MTAQELYDKIVAIVEEKGIKEGSKIGKELLEKYPELNDEFNEIAAEDFKKKAEILKACGDLYNNKA